MGSEPVNETLKRTSAHSLGPLEHAMKALEDDLLADGGPQISTMKNYNFAILPYEPREEFDLRKLVHRLTAKLEKQHGWSVYSIGLHQLLINRLHRVEDGYVESLIALEKRLFAKSPEKALSNLIDDLQREIEGPEGLAGDVVAELERCIAKDDPDKNRTVFFIGRAGALYPFFRTSALLRHIAGRTKNIPVVLLYPGSRREGSSLSFMGEVKPDGDYRPRIYP